MSAERILTLQPERMEIARVHKEQYTDLQMRIMEKSELSCRDVSALLGDYVDNDIPTSLRARVAAKIEECPCCEQNFMEYKQVVLLAAEMREPPKISSDIQMRLRKNLSDKLGIKFKNVD